jgi:hypothetical protein
MSFQDIAGWMSGYDNGRPGCGTANNCPRTWVSPAFMSTRDVSYEILEQLGAVTMGEQKISMFPHWTVSTQTNGRRFAHLSIPTSEWYVGSSLTQSLDDHTNASVDAAVDFYYNLGALINLYGHNVTNDAATHQEYAVRSLTKPRLWSTNAVGLYDWWQARSAVQVAPSYQFAGGTDIANVTISGATNPETAIELVLPNWSSWGIVNPQVYLNGALAPSSEYRFTSSGLKVRVGTTVSTVEVRYNRSQTSIPTPGVCYGEEAGSYNVKTTPGWSYRYGLNIYNNTASTLPTGYSVKLTLDTAGLIAAGKLRPDGSDLRVVWVNGATLTELDRAIETPLNSPNTEIWFKTQAAIPGNGNDGSYFIYYGNPAADPAPADRSNVYALYDSFEGSTIDAGK